MSFCQILTRIKEMRKIAIIQIILSGICFGLLSYFGKMAYQKALLPGELLALRYSMAAGILFFVILLKDKSNFLIGFKNAGISILLGVFGYALFSSLYFYALTGVSASLTVLLLYTYPIMISIISILFLKEKFNLLKMASLTFVSLGMYLLVKDEWKITGIKYVLAGLGSAFFYSLYIIYSGKYLEKVSAISSSFYVQIGAGLILSILNFNSIDRVQYIISEHFVFIFMMAFICSFLAMTLFLEGLKKLSAVETSILSTTEPISAVFIAYFFLGEKLSLIQVLGALFILIGVISIAISGRKKETIEPLSA